jgi:hypothetical protein
MAVRENPFLYSIQPAHDLSTLKTKIEKPKKTIHFLGVVESKKVTRNRTHLDRKDSVGNKRIFIEVF